MGVLVHFPAYNRVNPAKPYVHTQSDFAAGVIQVSIRVTVSIVRNTQTDLSLLSKTVLCAMSWFHHLLLVHRESLCHSAGGLSSSCEPLISLSSRKEVDRAASINHLQGETFFEEELGNEIEYGPII